MWGISEKKCLFYSKYRRYDILELIGNGTVSKSCRVTWRFVFILRKTRCATKFSTAKRSPELTIGDGEPLGCCIVTKACIDFTSLS